MSHLPDNYSQAAFSARYEPRLLPLNTSERIAELAAKIRRISEFRSWVATIDPSETCTLSIDDALADAIDDLRGLQMTALSEGAL